MINIGKTTTTNKTDLQSALAAIRDQAEQAETDARRVRLDVERAIKLARGTRDVTAEAAAVARAPLAERVEAALRVGPMSLVELADAVGDSGAAVQKELRRMRAARCPTRSTDAPDARMVYNHGTEYDPRWSWVVGDQTPTAELSAAVEKMITTRPYTFAELTAATGARRGRLSGVLVKFQRDERDIVNENGTDRQYRWKMKPLAGGRRRSATGPQARGALSRR